MRNILVVLLAALTVSGPADAACQIGKLLELKITMQGARPLTDVGINGRSIPFIVDSGAFFSSISPGTAAELGLRLDPSPVQMRGIGGAAGTTYVANVKSLNLAGIPVHNIQFIVGGSEVGVGGLLGQNVLGLGDVEYDLEHGAIRVVRASGCSSKNNLAYWAGDRPVSELAVERRDASQRHTIGTILVNGAKIRALFDTGAGSSILSLEAAKRAGLTASSPGVIPAGLSRGLGRSMVQTWLVPIANVKIGTEEVRDIKLRMANVDLGEAEMLIGVDFFLSHRVYVANSLREMFFTYDGGPVFNMTPSKVVDEAGAAQSIALDKGPEPTDPAGFSRRGAAEASRRDYAAAIADLDRAIAMEPNNGRYVLQRARTRLVMGNRPAAFADLDRAAQIAPNDPEIRLAHAESLVGRKRSADAQSDLRAVDAALPRQADERLALANMFEGLDQFDKAIANYDLWIAAHPDDSRQPAALNGRCWSRALAGRDLPLALKDCNAALRRMKSGSLFDSRGMVELRLGQYDQAIKDYDEALQLAPRTAWSLYGRGLARRHKNDLSGQKDLDAAVAIDPGLPARARTLGIS
jgi:tetratricopeptide (TPR) repeat protein/predicted aspartyl protease